MRRKVEQPCNNIFAARMCVAGLTCISVLLFAAAILVFVNIDDRLAYTEKAVGQAQDLQAETSYRDAKFVDNVYNALEQMDSDMQAIKRQSLKQAVKLAKLEHSVQPKGKK